MLILKKSSHSVARIECRTFAILPRQQFHWGVLVATRIGKLWRNKKILCHLHVNCLGCISRMIKCYDYLVFSGSYFWCFWFGSPFNTHQFLCMIECWQTSICQHLNVPLVHHSTSCSRVLKNQKHFTKNVQPSRLNVRCTCIWTWAKAV